jgi:hypothetical protein
MGWHNPETGHNRRVKIPSRTYGIKAEHSGKLRRNFQPENRTAFYCKENLSNKQTLFTFSPLMTGFPIKITQDRSKKNHRIRIKANLLSFCYA